MRETLVRAFERIRKAVVSLVKGYAVIVWGKSERAGVESVKTLIRTGLLSWLGLLSLLANLIITVYLALQAQAYPTLRTELWEGEEIAVPAPALYFSLLFIALGWAYVLCGVARAGPLVYLAAAAYVAFYGLYPGINLVGTFWFTLSSLWILALGTWAAAASPASRWRRPVLLALSLLVALTTYSFLGIRAIVPIELEMWGKLALGGVYFALVANPWILRKRHLSLGAAFATTLIILTALYAASLRRCPVQEVLANTYLAANGLLGLLSLFWYWIGLRLFNRAQDLAEWLVGTIKALVPRRALVITIFFLWFAWSILARLLTFTPPLFLVEFLGAYCWGRALLCFPSRLPMDFLAALDYDFYITIAISLIAFFLWGAKRLSSEGLIGLFGLSLTAFFILWGYFGNLFEFASEEGVKADLWPILVYVGGMMWEIFKVSPGLLAAKGFFSKARLFLFLGFLLLLGGISHLELSAGYTQFERELSLNPFLGVIYLGLPYLLYTFLYQQKRYTPVSSRHLLILFALGMLSAIPALLLKVIFLAPAVWLTLILGTVWRWGRWDERWDGLVYTIALALGFVTFYTHPIFIPIPAFTARLGYLIDIQRRYMFRVIYPWDPAWWRIALGALGAAVIMGYLLSEARLAEGYRVWVFALLGFLASLAFLAACEFAFGF